jgi:predicted PolB exonuclease-like 3'-5' exonuclease
MAKKEITQGDMAKTEKKKKRKKKGKKIMNLQIHIIVSFSTHLILLERF